MAKRMDARAGNSLATLGRAARLLATCQSADDAKEIRDQAEAMRIYAKQQLKSLEAQNYAAEIKLRAERRAGELLAAMDPKGSRLKNLKQNGPKSHDETSEVLSTLGISKSQSHRWQTEASLPEEEFADYVRKTHESRQELTSSQVYKLGKRAMASTSTNGRAADSAPQDAPSIVGTLADLDGQVFGCIYADPPWKYGNQGTRAATNDHYNTLSVDELCEWPVETIAAKDAHLHLWTTNAFLPEAFRVISAWGFEYRSCFVWVKPNMGIGNYWRVSHEFLLLGIRGNAKRFSHRSLKSWGEYRRTRHSAKPEPIREMIEKASPGPYLELFGRNEIPGWTVLGNKVEPRGRGLFE